MEIDSEISKALALAIGWPQVSIYGILGCMVSEYDGGGWKPFDYTDWRIAGPIASRLNAFPYETRGHWSVDMCYGDFTADTPQKAIAFAVIGGITK